MKTIRIAGVPEHFNLPWHMALDEAAFEERGICLQWLDVPEGTGKMCELLRNGETELAVILTEGIVKSIIEGNPARIVQQYIGSPLLWGIHVEANSPYMLPAALENKTVAVSRMGSGSHLMAFLHAKQMGWDEGSLQIEIVDHLEGAVWALTHGKADYFMWEHFTTKPLVDQGIFRRLGDYPTPWPCFVIAGSNHFLKQHPGPLRHILEVINRFSLEFRDIPSIDRTLALRYGQQLGDIREWLSITEWSQGQINLKTIENVQDRLFQLKLINRKIPFRELVYQP